MYDTEGPNERDDDNGFEGDPRRCPHHPTQVTSSDDGMFDAPCGYCEHEGYEPPIEKPKRRKLGLGSKLTVEDARYWYRKIRSRSCAPSWEAFNRVVVSRMQGVPLVAWTPSTWIMVSRLVGFTCPSCQGSGLYRGHGTCFRCNGKGDQTDRDVCRNIGYDRFGRTVH